MRRSLFFKEFAGLRPAVLLKKLRHRFFPVNFAKFLRAKFLQNTSERLLPKTAILITSVFRTPIHSGIFTNFESFISNFWFN